MYRHVFLGAAKALGAEIRYAVRKWGAWRLNPNRSKIQWLTLRCVAC